MSVGDSSLFSGESYLGVGKESTFGTYSTATAGLCFLSSSLKVMKDSKILEQICRNRTYSKSFPMSKVIEGEVSFYPSPDITSTAYMLGVAMGGTVTSASATGETAGGSAFTHTFVTGSNDISFTGLSINHRKGPSTSGKIWEYHGGRINTLGITAEIDNPLVMNAGFIFLDATQNSNDIESAFTSTAFECLSFADGRFSVENSFGSLTSSSFWHVQSINFTINNSLKNDTGSRRIGSDTLDVLPVGIQSYELSVNMRFDTTTAYDAMINASELSAEFEFLGTTLGTSVIRRGLKFQFQKLTVKDSGDPEIGGPDETLISTVTFNVLRDESAAGYAIQAQLTNDASSI